MHGHNNQENENEETLAKNPLRPEQTADPAHPSARPGSASTALPAGGPSACLACHLLAERGTAQPAPTPSHPPPRPAPLPPLPLPSAPRDPRTAATSHLPESSPGQQDARGSMALHEDEVYSFEISSRRTWRWAPASEPGGSAAPRLR